MQIGVEQAEGFDGRDGDEDRVVALQCSVEDGLAVLGEGDEAEVLKEHLGLLNGGVGHAEPA